MNQIKKLWIGLGIFAALCPLGLILPAHFKAGDAWGEWGPETIQKLAGYVPSGFAKLSELWKAPLPDYSFIGWEEKPLQLLGFSYIVSAVVGIAAVAVITYAIGKFLKRKENQGEL
ncbi:MAG: PDGLE domain-containing protein [Candidatus Margulisbacteria bacterium]|nr:PDGLE domain-containing protein [Candidatus Margulisiibacteriota bacterium]